MAKFLLVALCFAVVGVLAEPPAPSNYLPPQARNSLSRSYGAPEQSSLSRSYGAPQQGYSSGFGGRSSGSHSYNSIAESQFGGPSRSRYNSQSSQRYNAPSASSGFDDSVVTNAAARFAPARQTGASFGASRGFSSQPRQQPQFSTPSFRQQSAPAPQFNSRQQPASSYSAPAPQFNNRQQSDSSYAAAARQQPSTQYGAPSSEYGAPLARKMDDDLAEPANYEYNYEVQAGAESGAEFGHQETREDDYAQGEYHVLLPDGRMQIVEYEADEEGFRPKIRYEETGYPDARNSDGPY